MKRLIALLVFPLVASGTLKPVEKLKHFNPQLTELLYTYSSQVSLLTHYAEQQGFQQPVEKQSIVAHELIHIASAENQGYWNNGQILDGYERKYWWGITNRMLIATAEEQAQLAPIMDNYVKRTPQNTLGNILDEINAYSQTIGFVCLYESSNAYKQTRPLIAHLTLLNIYLRTYRVSIPSRYSQLRAVPVTHGIIGMIASQSWTALGRCGIQEIAHQEEVLLFVKK